MHEGMEDERQVQQLTIRVPREIHEALKTLSFATDRKVNEIVLSAVRDYLAGEGHREAVDAFFEEGRERYRVALDKLADL
jgi:hypothetical protein